MTRELTAEERLLPDEMRFGNREQFSVSIGAIAPRNQPLVSIPLKGVTVIVGGNNAGKSTLLKEIDQTVRQSNYVPAFTETILLGGLKVEKSGSLADAADWLLQHVGLTNAGGGVYFPRSNPSIGSTNLSAQALVQTWGQRNDSRLGDLGGLIEFLAVPHYRNGLIAPTGRRHSTRDTPTHPFHELQDRRSAFEELRDSVQAIFNVDITLDLVNANIALRYGSTDIPAPPLDQESREYTDAIDALPHVITQGDGFQSALGLLLPLIASWYQIVLIDEPEAFLHPPQAFALGRQIMLLSKRRSTQVLVSTHDQNFMAGLLSESSGEDDLSIVRLQRDGTDTRFFPIPPNDIATVWRKPQLRFSNVMDGLFHDAVVIAENDRDCLFYQSAVSAADARIEENLLFTPCYGKGGAPEIAAIMRSASVPTVMVLDLDTLNDKSMVKRLAKSLGREWTDDLDADYNAVTAQFRVQKKQKTNAEVLTLVESTLRPHAAEMFGPEIKKQVDIALSTESTWQALKDYGMSAFRSERKRADGLIEKLDALGLVLMTEGELERLAPDLGVSKGSAWVRAALDADAHKNDLAQKLAQRIINSIRAVSRSA